MNGYRVPNIDKINNMVFAEKIRPFKTKLNKLLFLCGFSAIQKTLLFDKRINLSIQKGPVPRNYDWIFDNTMVKKMVNIQLQDYGEYIGERFVKAAGAEFHEELFPKVS